MAAVFYPGKVLYALFPYPWAARLYVIAHTPIAFLGTMADARSFGLSWVGSCLGGLSYAFGAPVLLLNWNVIFLVGAAWIPWGLHAIDGLLRHGRPQGAAELALVLAPSDAGRRSRSSLPDGRLRRRLRRGAGVSDRKSWDADSRRMDRTRSRGRLDHSKPGDGSHAAQVRRERWPCARDLDGHRRRDRLALAPPSGRSPACAAPGRARGLRCLGRGPCGSPDAAGSGVCRTDQRMSTEPEINIYYFSLDPFRIVELVWPNLFGTNAPQSRSWIQAIPSAGDHQLWIDSIYVGGLIPVLAISCAGLRSGPPWRVWLTVFAVVGLVGSFGKYGSPLWWARCGPFTDALGPHDPAFGQPRTDLYLDDGWGSLYGIIATLLPGFRAFRYPSKLLTFSAAAVAVLAAAGWDRATAGETKWARRFALGMLAMSLVGLTFALVARAPVVDYLAGGVPPRTGFAPNDVAGAWTETQQAFAQGVVVFAVAIALIHFAPRRPRTAGRSPCCS